MNLMRKPGRVLLRASAVIAFTSLLGSGCLWSAPAPAFRVLVTNERSGTLSVLDGATYRVTATVRWASAAQDEDFAGRQLLYAASGS
jgi:YVTN family beta-propeller protein